MKNFERTSDPGRNSCCQLLRKNNPSLGNFSEILVAPSFFPRKQTTEKCEFPRSTKYGKIPIRIYFERSLSFNF